MNEMDLLKMTDAQKLAWLLASRVVLFATGAAWVGVIIWFLAKAGPPWFMIGCVPGFALLRFGLYRFYRKKLKVSRA